jgi:hypothetical protein
VANSRRNLTDEVTKQRMDIYRKTMRESGFNDAHVALGKTVFCQHLDVVRRQTRCIGGGYPSVPQAVSFKRHRHGGFLVGAVYSEVIKTLWITAFSILVHSWISPHAHVLFSS